MYVYMYGYMCICIQKHTHTHVCVYIYTYIHTVILFPRVAEHVANITSIPTIPNVSHGRRNTWHKNKISKVSTLVYFLYEVTMESSNTIENLCLLARGSHHAMTPQLLHPHPPPRACAGAMPQRRLRRVGRWLRTGCPPSRAQRHRPASALRRPPRPPSPPHPHHRASSGCVLGGLALLRRRLSPTVRRN